ncbi:hydantoinase/oxoprolinase family protein [Patulibacter defluvii]|uniref:hydantoinase/oxoprolinase family protein n=1 Tax=Patulibacter defluvii TaxID=3095358 RepID=UPI002A7529F5|nr:hydantoinase/oxoprolinase family protein [Patulibacter sp. DM4]
MRRISVDIGGTFTDCFLTWDEQRIEAKALTTHHNLSEGFLAALENAAAELGSDVDEVLGGVESVRYATTLGTNALIERSGPRLGLITTAGYEDTIILGRGLQYGDGLTDLEQSDLPGADRPTPLIDPEQIVGIRERVDQAGDVVVPADREDVRRAIQQLVEQGVRGFVVVLMHAVANPVHEDLVEEVLLEEYPGSYLGAFPIVCSHDVSLKKGEYARSMSAIIDAYLHHEMQHGLRSLERALRERGYRRPMQIVHNSGGMAQLNRTHALQTLHAGPVAGLNAAEQVADELEIPDLITVDMGGTSFDIGMVTGGGIRFYEFDPIVDRWRVQIPMVSMVALGAGGGSIARYDSTHHAIQVGPESAGSDPGPVCFDMGGREPTVTDADVVLGYIDPDYYYGGKLQLNRRRAERAIARRLGEPLGISAHEAAAAVRRIVDNNMAQGIFKEVALKGYDPRRFTILAYGGNGPTHACGFAQDLGVVRVLVPRNSAIFSAVGAGNMDQLHIHERSVYLSLYDATSRSLMTDVDVLNRHIDELRERGRHDIVRQGFAAEDVAFRVEFDMRYGDQLQLTSMVLPFERFASARQVLDIIKRYHDSYGDRFGQGTQTPETGIKVNQIRVVAYVPLEKVRFAAAPAAGSVAAVAAGGPGSPGDGPTSAGGTALAALATRTSAEPKAHREAWFDGAPVETPVHDLDALPADASISGPALVEAPHSTFVVAPGWELRTTDPYFIEMRRIDQEDRS